MKMRKLLATSLAASVAAGSLATAASAAEKTFDMGYSVGNFNGTAKFSNRINDTIGKSADQATMKCVWFTVYGVAECYIDQDDPNCMGYLLADGQGTTWWYSTNGQGGTWDYKNVDLAKDYVGKTELDNSWWEDANVTIKGYKYDKEGKPSEVSETLKLKNTWTAGIDGGKTTHYFYLPVLADNEPSHKDYEFAPYYFDEIYSADLSFNYRASTTNELVYRVLSTVGIKYANVGSAFVTDWDYAGDTSSPVEYDDDIANNKANLAKENANKASALIAYLFAHGGYAPSEFTFPGADVSGSFGTGVNYDILHYTENELAGSKIDGKIFRNEALLLSNTGSHMSNSNAGSDGNQTYVDGDLTAGTGPVGFAGFASQVANFFNKQSNGTITFTFEAPSASATGSWVTGGIPSTEVGLQNVLDGSTVQDFALFFNYGNTGGVMLSAVKVDAASGSVTFDISEYLDTCGGLTTATLENIYYGLTKDASIKYTNKDADIGLKVKEVKLAYEEDEAEDIDDEDTDDEGEVDADEDTSDEDTDDEDTDDEDTDDEDTDDEDADDEDADMDDEDEDASADDEDEADEDDDVNGDVVTTPSEDDDTNPATGVALAVVPALVAAAAAVVSKKRK